jgi:hypothetical protein
MDGRGLLLRMGTYEVLQNMGGSDSSFAAADADFPLARRVADISLAGAEGDFTIV